ncbi:MAG: hypothetical protein ACRD30_06585, partial [Bryobacteraceae bacterium]
MWDQTRQALNQSALRALNELASLIPGVVALAVAVAVSFAIAIALYFLIRRISIGLRLDERLMRWGFRPMAEWSPAKSPSLLVARIVFWVILLAGFLIGIAAFESTLTSQFVFELFGY